MSRIWNSITRGFRARPPASPSQTSSQRNEDNDVTQEINCLSTDEDVKRYILKLESNSTEGSYALLRPIGSFNNSAVRAVKRVENRDHGGRYDGYRIYFKIWDHLLYGAASALLIRYVGNYVVNQRVGSGDDNNKEIVFTSKTKTFKEKWNLKIVDSSLLPYHTTVRSILSKVPAVSLPCSTVYAVGETSTSNRNADGNRLPIIAALHGKTANGSIPSILKPDSIPLDSTHVKNKPVEDKVISDEDLEVFISSAQDCVRKAYNVQGIGYYKAGNYMEAFQCFELGSKSGSSKAQFNLGLCYQRGKGTKKDLTKAMKQYRQAARQGHKMAQYNLALMLLETNNIVKHTHALLLLEQAAEHGLVQAQSLLGSYLAQKGVHNNMKKAVRMFQLASEQEDALSTYHLAECYEHGLGDLDVDSVKAFDLYATSADQGHLEAHFKMASILYNGCAGIESDHEMAMEVFKRAADMGHLKSLDKYTEMLEKKQSQEQREIRLQSIPAFTATTSKHTFQSKSATFPQPILPELVHALNPSPCVRNESFLSLPQIEEVSLVSVLLSNRVGPSLPLVNSMHRVSTWPHSLLQPHVIMTSFTTK